MCRLREQARIQRILALLQSIWELQPDLRFNQLVSNLQRMYSSQNDGYGSRKVKEKCGYEEVETSYMDFFYLEDDEWEEFLISLIDKGNE